ncbi:protein of unknown function [Cupriavidus taiwanensis]|nr:protein of unknown function [Cupriavidus taiwanensis]
MNAPKTFRASKLHDRTGAGDRRTTSPGSGDREPPVGRAVARKAAGDDEYHRRQADPAYAIS